MNIEKIYSDTNINIADNNSNYIPIDISDTLIVCEENCEFYDKCLMQKEFCVKQYFENVLCSLLPVEETIIRSMFGILCPKQSREKIIDIIKNDPMCIIDDALAVDSVEKISAIKRKTLRKLRHRSRGKILLSEEMCSILFSCPKDTCYSKLWKQIFKDNRSHQELFKDFGAIKNKK